MKFKMFLMMLIIKLRRFWKRGSNRNMIKRVIPRRRSRSSKSSRRRMNVRWSWRLRNSKNKRYNVKFIMRIRSSRSSRRSNKIWWSWRWRNSKNKRRFNKDMIKRVISRSSSRRRNLRSLRRNSLKNAIQEYDLEIYC